MANTYASNALVPDAKIDEEVRKAVGLSLRKDPAAIRMEASVMDDLGGTSLDFLDMTFRLEQAFGVRLSHSTVIDHIEETFGEGKAIDGAGCLTKDAVEVLRARFGNDERLKPGMYGDDVPRMVTPSTLSVGVREILSRIPAACPHCRASAWKAVDGTVRVKCGSCGKDAVYPDGDALVKSWLEATAAEKHLFGR